MRGPLMAAQGSVDQAALGTSLVSSVQESRRFPLVLGLTLGLCEILPIRLGRELTRLCGGLVVQLCKDREVV